MRFAKALVVAAIALSIGAYSADCLSITPMQAMQCCKTMPCAPNGHGKNCCKTMPLAHAPFVQNAAPSASIFTAAALLGLAPAALAPSPISATRVVEATGHAPPILPESLASTPLRI